MLHIAFYKNRKMQERRFFYMWTKYIKVVILNL